MINTTSAVIPDTQAILLLCGYFGGNQGDAPLKTNEYNKVVRWLHQHKRRPADLLNPDAATWLHSFPEDGKITGSRLSQLLARGIALGFEQERWAKQGIWVISRADSGYPEHMRKRLGTAAPVLLYGTGNQMLLKHHGVAVVGGRDADNESLSFARQVAAQCTTDGLVIISGGARGVDNEAVSAALEMHGAAIVVMAEGIAKSALSKAYRPHLAAQRLALVSPYVPQARWNAGNAMGRNKIVYALSQLTVVASSGLEGGTWEGANENMNAKWVPMLVRSQGNIPAGNIALINRGAIACTLETLDNLNQLIESAVNQVDKPDVSVHQLEKGVDIQANIQAEVVLREEEIPKKSIASKSKSDKKNVEPSLRIFEDERVVEQPAALETKPSSVLPPLAASVVSDDDLFHVVWPFLAKSFELPVPDADLSKISEKYNIQLGQLKAWLTRAVKETLVRKTAKPVRYRNITVMI